MSFPLNPQTNQKIIRDNFFAALELAETQRFYPKLSAEKSQDEITAVYTSLGSVPEPRQLSGIAGGGPRTAATLKDWLLTATVFEWESTVGRRRIVCEAHPLEVGELSTEMGFKAQKSMDKNFCIALTAATAGYDTVALYSTAHPESGTNQTNTSSTTAATGTNPTAAEMETALTTGIGQMKTATDDQGTPVAEGVGRYMLLVHPTMEFTARTVVSPLMSNQAVDSSGVTGKFRGLVDVIVSAYCTATGLPGGTVDRAFLFADPAQVRDRALATCRLADWQYSSNIFNESSDDWNKGEGYLRSWAAHVFMPWKWQVTQRLIWT
jgi:hypothetical protein